MTSLLNSIIQSFLYPCADVGTDACIGSYSVACSPGACNIGAAGPVAIVVVFSLFVAHRILCKIVDSRSRP